MEYVPSNTRKYIEPFAGSACMFFSLAPIRAVINDANIDLIETYSAVRADPKAVARELKNMPVSKDDYYAIRDQDCTGFDRVMRAARFIYLNRFCFNGLYRTNTSGNFNVPFGAPKNHNVPTDDDLVNVAKALETATLTCGDFEKVVKLHATKRSFIYLDPPYYRTSQRTFREYNAKPFNGHDLERLTALLSWLDDRNIKFLLSYVECDEAIEAFSKWRFRSVSITRNISGFAIHRRRSAELMIHN